VKRSQQLAGTWSLSPTAIQALEVLARRLSGDPHAPTSIRDPARVWEVHVTDSLLGLAVGSVAGAGRIADVGSGAGLPGLVLAAALPASRFDLIEAAGRKADWIQESVRAMGLTNAHAVPARAEDWAAGEGHRAYDVVLARAVDALPVLVEYAAPLLRTGGELVAWKRNLEPDERRRGVAAAELLGMEALTLPHDQRTSGSRTELVVYRKTGDTPPGYPRRPGRARKRPLA
jgi:16S rRNA (guanine527-N7)-methyltransferase